jgi:hypothetical protein
MHFAKAGRVTLINRKELEERHARAVESSGKHLQQPCQR